MFAKNLSMHCKSMWRMLDRDNGFLRYLCVGYGLIPIPMNFGITYVISWVLLGRLDSIPVWGFPASAHMELLGVNLFLPLITAAICIRQVDSHLNAGVIDAHLVPKSGWWRMWAPRSLRGYLVFVLASGSVLAAPTYVIVQLVAGNGDSEITIARLILWKSIYAGVLGLIVTPLIVVAAVGSSKPLLVE